jgi:hypothetical protein
MAIQLSTFLLPKNNNTFFLLEDKFIKGGLRSCVDHAERDAINALNRKKGMIVVTQNDTKLWMLETDKVTWTEVTLGGGNLPVRQTLIYTTQSLATNASENFTLAMGKSCLLYELRVDSGPCELMAYSEPTRAETNPYTFKALVNHLVDDGTTFLSDGTPVKGRRYSILMNLENSLSDNIYWTLVNKKAGNAAFTVTLSFLPIE